MGLGSGPQGRVGMCREELENHWALAWTFLRFEVSTIQRPTSTCISLCGEGCSVLNSCVALDKSFSSLSSVSPPVTWGSCWLMLWGWC